MKASKNIFKILSILTVALILFQSFVAFDISEEETSRRTEERRVELDEEDVLEYGMNNFHWLYAVIPTYQQLFLLPEVNSTTQEQTILFVPNYSRLFILFCSLKLHF